MVDDNTNLADTRRQPVVSPGLRRLLHLVLLLVALLVVNSTYLATVTVLEHVTAEVYQDFLYLGMFLAHLVLGLLLIVPFLLFGGLHLRRAVYRPNRYAVRAGAALFSTGILVLLSGVFLTRFGFFEVNDPGLRRVAYWLHVGAPLVAVWLFVLHRLAGRRVRWSLGLGWGGVAVGFTALMVGWHLLGPHEAGLRAEPAFATTLIRTPPSRS